MCGLVGIAGDITYEARSKIFRDLLDVCQIRGRDSTGVIKVAKNLEYDWVKQVGPPSVLCDSRTYDNRIERGDTAALIGHCRSKTIGEVNLKNAHPFDFHEEGICGVHNGTLRGYHSLDTFSAGKVDSEILYGHLAKNGVDDTFPLLEGAFACVWWDNNTKTLNFIRNDQRPLWFTWSKDKKMMFWASERWFFGAVSRKIDLWDGGEDKKVYVELPINTLWSFHINPDAKGDAPVITMAPAREVQPKPRPTYKYNHQAYNRHHWREDWEDLGNGQFVRRHNNSPENNGANSKNNNDGNKGGEVVNPFLLDKSKLDDPLPPELAPTGKENSNLSNVAFLRRSITGSDSSTGQTPTKSSHRNILSLPAKTSQNSQQKTNGGCCDISERSSGSTPLQMRHGVSLRTVVGIRYITDNPTKTEWSAEEFFYNTGGQCSFCSEDIMGLDEVAVILNKHQFICKTCMEEPKETARLIA